jgi:antitoxin component YwqK of YwqJK toxin-antitoxin module
MRKIFYLLFLCSGLLHSQSECSPTGYTGKKVRYYYDSKITESIENYQDGMLHGEVTDYYRNGEVMQKRIYKLGKLTDTPLKIDYDKKRRIEAEEYRKNHPEKEKPVYTSYYNPRPTRTSSKKTGDSCTMISQFDYKNRLLSTVETCTLNRNIMWYEKAWDTLGNLKSETTRKNYLVLSAKEYYPGGNIKSESTLNERTLYNYAVTWTIDHKRVSESISFQASYSGDHRYLFIQKEYDEQERITFRREQSHLGMCYITYDYSDKNRRFFITENNKVYFKGALPDNNYLEGHFEKDEVLADRAIDARKEEIFEGGKGKFKGPYWMVAPNSFLIHDTIRHPKDAGYTAVLQGAQPGFLNMSTAESEMRNHSEIPLCLFATAEGHFKNGKKSGTWHFTNPLPGYHYYDEVAYAYARGSMKGSYEEGIRTGEWKYENGLGKIVLNYKNGEAMADFYPAELSKKLTAQIKATAYNDYPFFPKYAITGKMKNEFPDGYWDCYSSYPEKRIGKYYFENGRFMGIAEELYDNGALRLKMDFSSAVRTSACFYSPEGDILPENYYAHQYMQMKEGKANGKYLTWDYTGKIIDKGFYKNGKKNGEWTHFKEQRQNYERFYISDAAYDIYGDSSVVHYLNDSLHGPYFHKTNYLEESGNYTDGKKDGLWKLRQSAFDTTYKEEMFDENQCYLLNYFDHKKQTVKNGFGSVKIKSTLNDLVIEDFYENGTVLKSVGTHTLTNTIESITWKTPHGDSLAYYLPANGGTCIKDGTGAKSLLDEDKILYEVDHYKKGKITKVDYYVKGVFNSSVNYFTSSDSSYNYGSADEPLITRKIELTNEGLMVTMKLCNLKQSYKNMNVSLSVGFGVKRFADTTGFREIQKINNAYFRYVCNEKHGSEMTLSFYVTNLGTAYDGSIGLHLYYFENKKRHDVDLFNNKSPKGFYY